jgi:hypothetical protein
MRFWANGDTPCLNIASMSTMANDNKGPYFAGINTKKQIFEALGLKYRPSEDRDV